VGLDEEKIYKRRVDTLDELDAAACMKKHED